MRQRQLCNFVAMFVTAAEIGNKVFLRIATFVHDDAAQFALFLAQADGGTRCASITGAFVALVLALSKLKQKEQIRGIPVTDYVAATSVGIVGGMPLLDLAYEEDSKADVDMNIVKTSDGRFIEIQGTAEAEPFSTDALTGLLALADLGINELVAKQREIVGAILGR